MITKNSNRITLTKGQYISYDEYGAGSPIILLHGLGSNKKSYQKLAPLLAAQHKVYAIDIPKYLDTDDKSLISLTQYADLIVEWMDSFQIDKADLLGHSMGAQIAIHTALRHSDKVQSLILLAPAGLETFDAEDRKFFDRFVNKSIYLNQSAEQVQQNFNVNFYGSKVPDDALFMLEDRQRLMQDSIAYGRYADYFVASVFSMLDQPVYSELPTISQPTLVIFGKDDMLIPNKIIHPELTVEAIASKANHIPNVQIELLENAGHFVQWDRPDITTKQIQTFLGKNQY